MLNIKQNPNIKPLSSSPAERLERRLTRERRAREQAESLLEDRARMLYEAKSRLEKLNIELEHRVQERTQELEQARHQALALAECDQLTGLANRRSFLKQLDNALKAAEVQDSKLAVLALDLDHFKDINDTLGHHAGDELLMEMAARLKLLVPTGDIVARLGGDEFAILCPMKGNTRDIALLASRIVQTLERPVSYEGHSMEVSCSVGISISPDHSRNSEDLQRYADIALYSTKERGRGD